MIVAGSAVAFPAMAQQQPGPQKAAPSPQTSEQMHQDAEKNKASEQTTGQAQQQQAAPSPQSSEQMHQDADKNPKASEQSSGQIDKPR
ncbi:hypothetical protein XI09_35720 [Bradyrhizobium sp. CCBAU 11386]|nr:hypothetical protein [Bradyrhizobium sp. CCBAU 11386]